MAGRESWTEADDRRAHDEDRAETLAEHREYEARTDIRDRQMHAVQPWGQEKWKW